MTRHRHAARKLLRTLFTGQLDLEGDLAVDEVESVLCSVSRAAEEAAREEERERCCADVCPDCLRGDPIAFDSLGAAIHLFQGDPANRCRATRIRARSRAQSPDAGRDGTIAVKPKGGRRAKA